jgi:hypothetical protein
MYGALRRARPCAHLLKDLPRADPPANSDAFYLIQMPVVEEMRNTSRSSSGKDAAPSFTPKLPHLMSHISDKQKLRVVAQLTDANERAWEACFDTLEADLLTPLVRVKHTHKVSDHGRVQLKTSRKTEQSILAKAHRPAILAENPSFSVRGMLSDAQAAQPGITLSKSWWHLFRL